MTINAVMMDAISELNNEGKLSKRQAKTLRRGSEKIVRNVRLADLTVSNIKQPILALSRFVEFQRMKMVKPKKVAGKIRRNRRIQYVPDCFKWPETQPFCS